MSEGYYHVRRRVCAVFDFAGSWFCWFACLLITGFCVLCGCDRCCMVPFENVLERFCYGLQKLTECVVYDDGVYHTPLGRFSMFDTFTAGIVLVPKRTVLEISRRELSEDVSFGIGTIGTGILLVVEQSSLEPPPRGYTPLYYFEVYGSLFLSVDRPVLYDDRVYLIFLSSIQVPYPTTGFLKNEKLPTTDF